MHEDTLVQGTIRTLPQGFAFLQTDLKAYPKGIFIPKHALGSAVDGDLVELRVTDLEGRNKKGPEGEVCSILERSSQLVAGTVFRYSRHDEPIAFVPLYGASKNVRITQAPQALCLGDRIVIEIDDWGDEYEEVSGRATEIIGKISDPSIDVKAAILEFGLDADFPEDVVEEAKSLGKRIKNAEIKERLDLREKTSITIDPDTAKDFDDALSVEKLPNGNYLLGIHIADVAHYVKEGSALDKEAKKRCNSTYFPGTCLPMLPKELSENLCSLRAKVNRLTVSVLVELSPEGETLHYQIKRSVIHSAQRYTYKDAKKILDGEKDSPHKALMEDLLKVCRILKKNRAERGSLEFALPELAVLVDEKGKPLSIETIDYDITHQIVEECMLKANETVALDLDKRGKFLSFRIHDLPKEDGIRDFLQLAANYGFHLSHEPSPKELQGLFDEVAGSAKGRYLATALIKSMSLAAYSVDNIGHYGLSLSHYCHFTSPIRRYPDLTVQRALFNELSLSREALQAVNNSCSQKERLSARAEGQVKRLKKLRLLNEVLEKNPQEAFNAIITQTRQQGLVFDLVDYALEGFVHVSELQSDYYNYDEELQGLVGRSTGFVYALGQEISVNIREINLITQELRFYLQSSTVKKEKKNAKLKKKKKRKR